MSNLGGYFLITKLLEKIIIIGRMNRSILGFH